MAKKSGLTSDEAAKEALQAFKGRLKKIDSNGKDGISFGELMENNNGSTKIPGYIPTDKVKPKKKELVI